MASFPIADLLGYLGSLLLTVMALPQLIAIMKNGTAGVSLPSWLLLTISALMWLVYGIQTQTMPNVVGNIAAVIAAGLVVAALVRSKRDVPLWFGLPIVLGAVVVCGLLLLLIPAAAIAAVGTLVAIASRYPQVLGSWSAMRNRELTNVSRRTWAICVAGGLLWVGYGVLAADTPVLIVNLILALSGLLIIVLETVGRSASLVGVQDGVQATP